MPLKSTKIIWVGNVQLRKRGRTWQARYSTPEGRIEYSLGRNITNQKLAIEKAREIDAKLQRGDWGGVREHERGRSTTIGGFLVEFKATYTGWSPGTMKRNNWILKHIEEEFGKRTLSAVGTAAIQRWLSRLHGTGLSASSVNWHRAALSTIFREAKDYGLVTFNPVKDTKQLRIAQKVPRALSDEEVGKLLHHLDPLGRYAVTLFLNTGFRRMELFNLQWRDINFEQRLIIVRDPKNKEDRATPMTEQAYEVLQEARKTSKGRFVVSHPDGKPITTGIKKSLIRASRDAGISPHVTHHVLRHTFGTRLRRNGVPIVEIKDLLGQKTLDVAMRYAQALPENLRGAIDTLAPSVPSTEDTES